MDNEDDTTTAESQTQVLNDSDSDDFTQSTKERIAMERITRKAKHPWEGNTNERF